jgi:hypothetical protein
VLEGIIRNINCSIDSGLPIGEYTMHYRGRHLRRGMSADERLKVSMESA